MKKNISQQTSKKCKKRKIVNEKKYITTNLEEIQKRYKYKKKEARCFFSHALDN